MQTQKFLYNFRNRFSCNFERSDQENKDRSVFDLKIIKKLNQKIIRSNGCNKRI